MRKAIQRRALATADATALPAGLHPVLRRVYAARGVSVPNDLEYTLQQLLSAELLGGLDTAAAVLAEAVQAGRRVLIVGDFDADGATSCALVMRALRSLGHGAVDYLVPNRFEYGYGLTPEIVELATERAPELLITVDNGISSLEGVAAAKARGWKVIVTDHHLPGRELPAADAIVNPNLPGDAFPSKCLAGVGVAFYLMLALRARLRESGWFTARGIPEPNMADLLDLVALGTVADVVPLDRNNRILVEQGLRRIRAGRCCPGILALLENGKRDPQRLVASDLGFAVGPRLNAAGRLEDMSLGIACLLADQVEPARRMAAELGELNTQRREIEAQMQADAMVALRSLDAVGAEGVPAGLCLMDPDWHQGVIGILASRVKERFHRPVIAFAPAGEGELKGSARSIPGLHIRDTLDRIASQNPGLIDKFGGHAMAAGLSLPVQHFERFRAAFAEAVAAELDEAALQGAVLSDGELTPADLCLDLAEALRSGGPWGQNFPEPLFDGEFEVVQSRIVGERHVKLVVRSPGATEPLDAIAFGGVEYGWHELRGRLRMVYRLDVNEYRGRRSVQLMVEYLEPVRQTTVDETSA